MFSTTLVSATALSLLAARGALADFSLTTSAFTQCQPAHLTWTGTSQAVNILLVPADKPCDETLVDLGDHSKGAMSWNVSLPAGTQLLVSAEDAKGEEAWSQTITVGASSDTSCLSAQQRASLPQTGTSGSTSGSASSSTSQTTTQGNTPTPDNNNNNNNNNNNTPTSDPSGNGDDSALNGLLGAANAGVGPKASSSAATFGSSAPLALAFSALVGASAVALF